MQKLKQFYQSILENYSIIQSMVRTYGHKSIIIFTHRFFEYTYYITFKRNNFIFNNQRINYFHHLYNTTFRKERIIEIPIVRFFMKDYIGKEILEVGNVLNHYTKFKHDVVDKYEVYPEVINEDILTYKPNKLYDLIISISTLEHIGWDEKSNYCRNKDKNILIKVIANLSNLLKNGGKLICTLPVGYNLYLDKLLRNKKLPFTKIYYMKRISKDNRWKQVNYAEVKDIKYGFPYQNANGVIIGIIHKHSRSFS